MKINFNTPIFLRPAPIDACIVYLSFFLLCRLILACAPTPGGGEAQEIILLQSTFPDGEPAAEQEARPDSVLHGRSRYFYRGGQLRILAHYGNGFREGPSETYYPDGQIESRHQYRQGIPDGAYQWFYPEGGLRQEGTFREQQVNGWVKNYFPSGALRSTFYYKDGHHHGEGFEYFPNRRLRNYFGYVAGRRRFTVQFEEDGQTREINGDPLLELKADPSALFQDNALAVSIFTALPPEWTGRIEIRYRTSYGQAAQEIPLAPAERLYRYRLPIARQKAGELKVRATITNPKTGKSHHGRWHSVRADTQGSIELSYSVL